MKETEFSKPLDLKQIEVTDVFWKKEMELIRTEVIPYQWEALNDRVEGAAPSFCMRNFKVAGKLTRQRQKDANYPKSIEIDWKEFEYLPEKEGTLEEKFYGFVFQDSDFAKWIEAVAYSLTQHPDPSLEKIADEAIQIVCQAQQPNGYLDTFYIINDMSKVFTNLRDHHELYCFGHLTEGAVAYYNATGKDALLQAAKRYADYIDQVFGMEEGKGKGYPGHEIAEMALMRLYEVTKDEKYLNLSAFFINQRGQRPYYFDQERGIEENKTEQRYAYHQAHLPVREQKEAVGHSVRATYLYSGMADLARETKEESLYQACLSLWDNMVNRKMYITGGIGSTHMGEAFTYDYDLPNDTAYAETCASIGLVFFARRLLEIKANGKIADVMEQTLYNGVLSGMALDGKSFFYVNPLEVDPIACQKDDRKKHVKPVRQKWFGCACCPPNLARLISSIGEYAYTQAEQELYIHLYIGANLKVNVQEEELIIKIQSQMPWDGHVTIQVEASKPLKHTVALRIPGWCESYTSNIDQKKEIDYVVKDGYLYLTKEWSASEKIVLDFKMKPRFVYANPKVREDVGKVAVMRGPIVYCLEEVDNGKNLPCIQVDPNDCLIEEQEGTVLTEPVMKLCFMAEQVCTQQKEEALYDTKVKQYEAKKVTMIPYYTWANRGENEMLVWIREKH
ncbi:glycoside hydrolase family 127 protein [Anaerosporobacter faecicola]|uniref:glycoside hydrolase family 127 protein n=1 Tax=Anaerosporobacter faecicola TaxID=2718714 RepID=UPI001439371C|nr:beta-L-arabinofuranosidase domain-containing protein [Anaerosporobacter faecicola]